VNVGDRVEVHAQWCSFYRSRGVVTAVKPHLMIVVDGDTYPIRFGEREVSVVESVQHVGGVE